MPRRTPGLISPCLVIRTTIGREYSLRPYVDPVFYPDYVWIKMKQGRIVTGLYYRYPSCEDIMQLAVVGDRNIKKTEIPPPLFRVSCPVPPSYIIDFFPYPLTSFMGDATLEGLKKVFVRRVSRRYCGMFIQYEDIDRPLAVLGQWAAPELRLWDYLGNEMALNSEKTCIYDSTKATPSAIMFKINWVFGYAYDIFFCNRDSNRLKLDPDSDTAKRTRLKAFDVGTRLSWWFMHNHDFIIPWKDDTPRQPLRVSEDHLIKDYIMEGDP